MSDDGEDTIKAVRNALGPDAKCDPYPKPEFKDGAALFNKRYADVYYRDNPDDVGKSFSVLKKTNAKHPTIQHVVKEYSEENKKYTAVVNQWRAKWPEETKRLDEARRKSSAQRKERKRNHTFDWTEADERGWKRGRGDGTLPWLTREWIDAKLTYMKRCRETGMKLLHVADEISEAYEDHRAFVVELERDREDVF